MRAVLAVSGVLLVLCLARAEEKSTWSIQIAKESELPEELDASIRKLLAPRVVQLLDAKSEPVLEVWFRREVPVEATEAQIRNGLTYAEVPSSTLMGAVRVLKATTDYRKQRLPEGVYTLRLASQPPDGDHAGTAPTTDFLLACRAAEDRKPDLLEVKALRQLSAKITEDHPSPLLLFPGKAEAEPKLVDRGKGHWVLQVTLDAVAEGKKAKFPLGLTLVGGSAKR